MTHLRSLCKIDPSFGSRENVVEYAERSRIAVIASRRSKLRERKEISRECKARCYIRYYKTRKTLTSTQTAADDPAELQFVRNTLCKLLNGEVVPTKRAWNRVTRFIGLRLITSTYQRPGAVANLTLDEVKTALTEVQVDEHDDIDDDEGPEDSQQLVS